MDDITIYGGTFEECLVNLEAVLKRCIEIILLTMLAILLFRWNIHDVQAHFQLSFLRSFNLHKSSLNISYPIGHAQLEITKTKTKKTK